MRENIKMFLLVVRNWRKAYLLLTGKGYMEPGSNGSERVTSWRKPIEEDLCFTEGKGA